MSSGEIMGGILLILWAAFVIWAISGGSGGFPSGKGDAY